MKGWSYYEFLQSTESTVMTFILYIQRN